MTTMCWGVQALQVARQQLSGAAAEAKQAEKALAELETAIPKVTTQLQYSTLPSLLIKDLLPVENSRMLLLLPLCKDPRPSITLSSL